MDNPNDGVTNREESPIDESEAIPKIGMINPGFKNFQEPLPPKKKSSGPKLKANRLDHKNRTYLILAILVVIAVICILEYKQICDARVDHEEVNPTSMFR